LANFLSIYSPKRTVKLKEREEKKYQQDIKEIKNDDKK
jgi:hypothetical protein